MNILKFLGHPKTLMRTPNSSMLFNDVASGDDRMMNECGAIGGMTIGGVNRSTRRKLAPEQLCNNNMPAGIQLVIFV
jgi:hypothetical protein